MCFIWNEINLGVVLMKAEMCVRVQDTPSRKEDG